MNTVLEGLRSILGEADFYRVLNGNNPTWDYAAMIEYFVGAVLLCIVVSSVFRIIVRLASK